VKPAGLILAAGASRRLGRTKALLTLSGETFVDRLIRMMAPQVSELVVVLGFHEARVREEAKRLAEATVVVNPAPEGGQLSSMQCGLRAIRPEAQGVLFTPVDYAGVREDTVVAVVKAWMESRAPVTAPRFQGKRGHPVCIGWDLAREILSLPVEGQARDVIRRHGAEAQHLEVDDPAVLMDVDMQGDYEALKAVVERV
jgi:molybdenum cofactor cytidylyltransferase